ncbi:hypothetical protein BGZ60DRAFT_432398 [Tricladium varicosporioides]|nr:hypothetical protein BGZ60DRAFT_432398 [Hymenoscyphus varicosporioides]
MNELQDIDDWLVTIENPPREIEDLDYKRCANLHNYILQYAWIASGRQISDFIYQSWYERYRDSSEEASSKLEPTLQQFLKIAFDPPQYEVSLFYWANGLNDPSNLWTNWRAYQQEEEDEYRFLTLYRANGMSHSDGLVFDQTRYRVSMFMSIDDYSPRENEESDSLWVPLETLLSNWIQMIRLGKITAVPEGVKLENERYFPWIYHSYSSAQVEDTLVAFNRLVNAIESRLPGTTKPIRHNAVIPNKVLDIAGVKDPSFARSFLRSIRLPYFKFIAPGILVPSPETFAQYQRFTSISDPEDPYAVPPVLLFPSEETFKFDTNDQYGHRNPFLGIYVDTLGSVSIPAGIYTDAISRGAADTAEEGFRFVLPYGIGKNEFVRTSDGGRLDDGNFKDLYQHGAKALGGDWTRAQRMVKEGKWEVDKDGVLGGIEKFKDADTIENWRDYWIEPDWFYYSASVTIRSYLALITKD